jgi:EmrB/QacA subfamily drug resistance transporter
VRGIGASPSDLQWSISSYTLVFAALLFTGGVLGDRQGHRRMLLTGMLIFGAASVWAGYANSPTALITARAVMGVGSALVMPATLSIIARVFNEKYRPIAIAVWSGSSGLAIAAGPLVSGALLERFWWGSVFLINVPFVVVGMIGAWLFLPASRNRVKPRFDPLGVGLSTVALFLVVYGVIQGGHNSDWSRVSVLAPMIVGVVLLVAFVLIELRVSNPSLDVRLFTNRSFTGASVTVMLAFFGLTGSQYYAVFYLQGARHMSPFGCGLALFPVAIGVLLGAPLSERLVKLLGIRTVVTSGMLVIGATFLAYAWMEKYTPLPWFWLLVFVQGFGVGSVMAPTTEAIVAALPKEQTGVGSAVNNSMRQVGGALGVAVLGSILTTAYRDSASDGIARAGVPEQLRAAVGESAEATRYVADLLHQPKLVDLADASFLDAMHITAIVSTVIALIGAVVAAVCLGPWGEESMEGSASESRRVVDSTLVE